MIAVPIVGKLAATCLHCGGRLTIVAQGPPIMGGMELRNILECGRCGRQYKLTIQLEDVTSEVGARPCRSTTRRHAAPCSTQEP